MLSLVSANQILEGPHLISVLFKQWPKKEKKKLNVFLMMRSGPRFYRSLCQRLSGSRPAELTAKEEGTTYERGVRGTGKQLLR